MKKLLIGILIIGLASLGYSQASDTAMEEVKLSDVTIMPLNPDYLDKVGESLSPWVFTLERKASQFDIKKSPSFIQGERSEILFTQRKGKINATYDSKGKIISTQEKYSNLLLPSVVRTAVYRAYPDWNMEKNTYHVSYNHKKGAKKVYKVQIRKEGVKKNLKFDVNGNGI